MNKDEILKELAKKEAEIEELKKALEEKEVAVEKELPKVDKAEILREIKEFPRYYINLKGEVHHESGLPVPRREENGKIFVKLFDSVNNLKEVEVEDLIKENF